MLIDASSTGFNNVPYN